MAEQSVRRTKGRGRLFDSILDTVGDTPVIRINNLAPRGVRLYVKAEFFNPAASSVKDRLALNIIEAAEGSVILAMLPDTGERYLTTPLFEATYEDMDEEERTLSLPTPGCQIG